MRARAYTHARVPGVIGSPLTGSFSGAEVVVQEARHIASLARALVFDIRNENLSAPFFDPPATPSAALCTSYLPCFSGLLILSFSRLARLLHHPLTTFASTTFSFATRQL
jgi:hypothetical protein